MIIGSSLTPIETVTTTLACSSNCYSKLATSHPSLRLASELVGGYAAVWELSYHLNVKRLEKLVSVFKQDDGGTAFWVLKGNGKVIVDVDVDEKSSKVTDEMASVSTKEKEKL